MAQIDSSAVMECRIELKYSTKSNSGPQWRSKGYQKVQNQTNIASLLKKKKIAILDGVISLFVLCWLFLSQNVQSLFYKQYCVPGY